MPATARCRPAERPTPRFANLRDPGGPACESLQATTLATLALDEVLSLRSASTTIDLAERALAAGLPLEPHRGENWVLAALYALMFQTISTQPSEADEILARARKRGAALTVVTISAFRSFNGAAARNPGRRRRRTRT